MMNLEYENGYDISDSLMDIWMKVTAEVRTTRYFYLARTEPGNWYRTIYMWNLLDLKNIEIMKYAS